MDQVSNLMDKYFNMLNMNTYLNSDTFYVYSKTYCYLSSCDIMKVLQLNTWTEVIVLSHTSDKNVYIITTEDKIIKFMENMEIMKFESYLYEKIQYYKAHQFVGVKINGNWFRGKLISYNEFQSKDTVIELIDIGIIYTTNIQNVFCLPSYSMYERLSIPIQLKSYNPEKTFKNFTKLTIKLDLYNSELHKGFVLVDVNYNIKSNTVQDEIKQLNKNEISILHCDYENNIQLSPSDTPVYNEKLNEAFNDKSLEEINGNNSPINILPNKLEYEDSLSVIDIDRRRTVLINNNIVHIKYVNNYAVIFIVKNVNFFNETMMTIKKDTSNIQLRGITQGDIVKVITAQNTYRAKIMKAVNPILIKVWNIDIGCTERVKIDSLYELPTFIKKIPGLAEIIFKVKVKKSIVKNTKELQKYLRIIDKLPLNLKYNKRFDGSLCKKDNSKNKFKTFLKQQNKDYRAMIKTLKEFKL